MIQLFRARFELDLIGGQSFRWLTRYVVLWLYLRRMDSDGMRVTTQRLGGREIALWSLLALLQFVVCFLVSGQARLGNDGYQYLSIVDNLSAGRGIATDIPYFDVERRHGVIPAPLTTFAPGFSIRALPWRSIPSTLSSCQGKKLSNP